jgi:hypothetical protein
VFILVSVEKRECGLTLKFDSRTWAGQNAALSALVMALIRSAVQADPARALCTTSLVLCHETRTK